MIRRQSFFLVGALLVILGFSMIFSIFWSLYYGEGDFKPIIQAMFITIIMGFLIMGTPYIDAIKNPCVMCDDLPCISACKDSALLPAPSKFDVKMGYAILDKNKCQAYGHTFCQQCVIDCPIPGAITQVDDKPVINKKDCTGCGVCMRSCSTVNIPVAIKIKPQMVIEYQIQKKKMEREKELREGELLAARQKELEEENAEAN